MYICYVDESGDTGDLPSPTSPVQPVLVVAGIVFSVPDLRGITAEFLQIKRRFFPGKIPVGQPFLDRMLVEIKGSDIRKAVRSGRTKEVRHAIGFLDKVTVLLERYHSALLGRVWIKQPGAQFNGVSVYTASIQSLCESFQAFLESKNDHGIMIADSRAKYQNTRVSHSIFTQKHRTAGDPFPRILDLPTFGHSENHAGLQLADLVCSALLFPFACRSFCLGHVTNIHVNGHYDQLKTKFGSRLRALQFLYQDSLGRTRGGVSVTDRIAALTSARLFT